MTKSLARVAAGFVAAVLLTLAQPRFVVAQDAPAAPAPQDLTSLSRVGTELARLHKAGALYAYLRDYHGAFFSIADKAGLAEALDGKLSIDTFDKRVQKAIAKSRLTDGDKDKVRAEASAFDVVLGHGPLSPGTGLTASEVKAKKSGDLVPELRKNLYDSNNHWISQLWAPEKRGSVGVKFVPGKLLWFNPGVSIPELGIRAGVPLTDEQKAQVASLFSFTTVPDSPDAAEGTAAYPEHVGRAINPVSHVLTVINSRGEVISDLVVKGGGPNRPNAERDGRLDRSEALLDSELARNLYLAGVDNYDSLCVVEPDGVPGKALLVRAPRSMLRHLDMDKLSDDELRKTLDHVLEEAAIRTGRESMSLEEWARDYLPRVSGENTGLLSGLGIEHGSIYTRDNHGLAETVDWGWAALHDGGKIDQQEHVWENVQLTVEKVNTLLGDAAKVSIDDVKKTFDAAFAQGQEKGKAARVTFDPAILDEVSEDDLRTLATNVTPPETGDGSSTSLENAEQARARLAATGHVADAPKLESIATLTVPQLLVYATKNGISIPPGSLDRATLAAAITKMPVADVASQLAHLDAHRPAVVEGPRTGIDDKLHDLIEERGKSDPVKDHGR